MTREQYGEAYKDGLNNTTRFLLSKGVKRDVALDTAQAAWVRGWEKLDLLRDKSVLLAWINSIALNEFREQMRCSKRHPYESLVDVIHPGAAVNLAAIDLDRILSRCSERDKVLLEKVLEGYEPTELAVMQQITSGAMRLRMFRARVAARRVVEMGSDA